MHFVIENIKITLGAEKLFYGRINWVWTNTANLVMDIDRDNLVDGILIYNFGITTTGSGVQLNVIDNKVNNHVVYSNVNAVKESLLSPFIYFVQGYSLNFTCSEATTYGFNYVTVSKQPL